MKKLSSTLPHMLLSLGLITIVSAAILSSVYTVTAEPIAQGELQKKIDAIAAVVPEFDNNPMVDTVSVDGLTVHLATKSGELVGAAVESGSANGFNGDISLMFGFDSEGIITGYAVLKHAETPGLGAKMGEWFRDTTAHRSVIGLDASRADLRPTKDGGEIDAITGSTITSRAFLEALRKAYTSYQQAKTIDQ